MGDECLYTATIDHDLLPMPRLAHGRRAKRDNIYFANRNELAWQLQGERLGPAIDRVCAVSAGIHIPNKRKSDIDNHLKALLDAMVYAGVIKDDHLVEMVSVRIYRGATKGVVMVMVKGM